MTNKIHIVAETPNAGKFNHRFFAAASDADAASVLERYGKRLTGGESGTDFVVLRYEVTQKTSNRTAFEWIGIVIAGHAISEPLRKKITAELEVFKKELSQLLESGQVSVQELSANLLVKRRELDPWKERIAQLVKNDEAQTQSPPKPSQSNQSAAKPAAAEKATTPQASQMKKARLLAGAVIMCAVIVTMSSIVLHSWNSEDDSGNCDEQGGADVSSVMPAEPAPATEVSDNGEVENFVADDALKTSEPATIENQPTNVNPPTDAKQKSDAEQKLRDALTALADVFGKHDYYVPYGRFITGAFNNQSVEKTINAIESIKKELGTRWDTIQKNDLGKAMRSVDEAMSAFKNPTSRPDDIVIGEAEAATPINKDQESNIETFEQMPIADIASKTEDNTHAKNDSSTVLGRWQNNRRRGNKDARASEKIPAASEAVKIENKEHDSGKAQGMGDDATSEDACDKSNGDAATAETAAANEEEAGAEPQPEAASEAAQTNVVENVSQSSAAATNTIARSEASTNAITSPPRPPVASVTNEQAVSMETRESISNSTFSVKVYGHGSSNK
jgi:hypothetical protein